MAERVSPEAAVNKEILRKLLSFTDTDAGNAEAFELLHGHRFRYDRTSGRWLVWNGLYWALDETGEAERAALDMARARFSAAALIEDHKEADRRIRWALRSEASSNIKDTLESTGNLESLATIAAHYDRDPFLLTVGNGTLDLHTGKLRAARPEDLVTRATDILYDPSAGAPRWSKFLDEIFAGDKELISFIQRAVGYSLTGDTCEQCFFILYGSGANGKTTFLETVIKLLGNHAVTAPFATFLVQRYPGAARNDLAALHAARFVKAAEAEHQAWLDEAMVKQLTGGDTISARFLYHEQFSYKPQFKIWLATNHKPEIRGTDVAIWRRIRLVPFERRFEGPKSDPQLQGKLEAELPGILAWTVRGCLEWQRHGLGGAPRVTRAVLEYRQESDQIGRFLKERCTRGPKSATPARELFEAYLGWCAQQGEKPVANNVFARGLAERDITKRRRPRGQTYEGVGLVLSPAPAPTAAALLPPKERPE